MIKAKNLNRLAIPAVLTLLLCYVASAGPTYSFVKVAGEWAFYDDNDGFNSTLEAAEVKNGLAKRSVPVSNEDELLNLPAIGSVVTLSGGSDSQISSLLTNNSSGGSSGSGAKAAERKSPLDPSSGVALSPNAYSGASSSLASLDDDSKSGNGSISSTLPNGKTRNTPNGNAWGYWKKRNNPDDIDDDIVSPVPVPVPGSIILAALGAGLVKLLHDRRVKR